MTSVDPSKLVLLVQSLCEFEVEIHTVTIENLGTNA